VLSVPPSCTTNIWRCPSTFALGLAAGMIGRFVEKEEIWSFTPSSTSASTAGCAATCFKPRIDRQILSCCFSSPPWRWPRLDRHSFRTASSRCSPSNLGLQALVWLCAPINVGIALKVWNALRIEMSLEEQKRLLLEARLDALQRQINPHFLFNTLNSIASLVRSQPEMAREMTVKLANILRALLKDHDAYVPLRDELKFTDDYLDIEVVRFGADKLRVEKGDRPAHARGPGAQHSAAAAH
jgi:two-component system, LytTR family, sensor kinase